MKWCIKLYPRGNSDENYISTFLSRQDDLQEACTVSFVTKFIACNKIESPTLKANRTLGTVFRGKYAWGYKEFIERNVVLRALISDILVIKYTLKPFSESNPQEIFPAVLYNSGLFTDVLLRARGSEFKVHKAILWARWPELAKRLDEQKCSYQDFDIRPNILAAMIKYIYTGKLEYVHNFQEISVTAAKYGVRILSPPPGRMKAWETRINTEKISIVWPIENFL
ncbi:speckle-type POZ protein-like B [Stegodyphus dumicola]|uniref:speckle-type POZ protein-like B n=1 Tax=Stegodyphus dumicola TaxID=202533 RepID=UPI0015B2DE87|nr:speckle-type POZ protein-like B [Stegodyphus dumicola]